MMQPLGFFGTALAVALAAAILCLDAEAADLWQYEAADGTLSFTDDPRRIPAAARDAHPRAWEDVDARVTTVLQYARPHRWRAPDIPEREEPEPDCGPVVVTRERLHVNGFDRPYYVSRDRCGVRVISEKTPVYESLYR